MFGKNRHKEKRVRGPFMRLVVKLMLFVLIFGAGGITGMFYGLNLAFSKMREHATHMAELPDNVMPRLTSQLTLTDEQLPKFDAVFRRHHAEITRLEADNAVKVHQEFYDMGKELLALLDEKQAVEFREILRKICTVFLPPIPLGTEGAVHHCPELWE